MGYEPILHLELRHDYYGDLRVDLEVQPLDPRAFARDDLLLRRDGASVVVLAPSSAEERPTEILLAVLAEDLGLITATKGVNWDVLPLQHLPLDQDDWVFGEAPLDTTDRPLGSKPCLGVFQIALDPEKPRQIAVRFECEEVLWAYHVLGPPAQNDLTIVDPDEAISFEDLGSHALPNGAEARVLRALQGIAARARPPQKFALQTPGNFGPLTLIEVLPAPSIDRLKPIHHAEIPAQFQADIFVTLN